MPPRIRLVFAPLSLVLFLVAAVPLYLREARRRSSKPETIFMNRGASHIPLRTRARGDDQSG